MCCWSRHQTEGPINGDPIQSEEVAYIDPDEYTEEEAYINDKISEMSNKFHFALDKKMDEYYKVVLGDKVPPNCPFVESETYSYEMYDKEALDNIIRATAQNQDLKRITALYDMCVAEDDHITWTVDLVNRYVEILEILCEVGFFQMDDVTPPVETSLSLSEILERKNVDKEAQDLFFSTIVKEID